MYNEVDAASQLLHYRIEQAGFCSIVLHPTWGSACYPATVVTNADLAGLLREMDRVRLRWEVRGEEHAGKLEERRTPIRRARRS